jgi:hypothetical protein
MRTRAPLARGLDLAVVDNNNHRTAVFPIGERQMIDRCENQNIEMTEFPIEYRHGNSRSHPNEMFRL